MPCRIDHIRLEFHLHEVDEIELHVLRPLERLMVTSTVASSLVRALLRSHWFSRSANPWVV